MCHVRERDPALLGALAYWAFNIAVLWACFHAFGDPPPLTVIVMGYFVGFLGNLLPLPGGIGGVDGGMIGAFAAFGVPLSLVVPAVLAYRIFTFWLPTIPGAIAYFQLRRTVARWREERHGRSEVAAAASAETGGPRSATILCEVTSPSPDTIENVIIVGSGPAGYTAALYTSRANLHPLVIEGFLWGGLLQQTTDVENYPGFPEASKARTHAEVPRPGRALRHPLHHRRGDEGRARRRARRRAQGVGRQGRVPRATVILAMGAEHKKLEVRGEEELSGRGVSDCATCDAAFFKEKPTMIVGGGDSAMEEAIFLSKFASKVVIVHRRDEFRASKIMLERARSIENIEWMTPYAVAEFHAGEKGGLEVARLRNTETDEAPRVEIAGAFIAIGHEPQSHLVEGLVDPDDEGYVITEGRSTRTRKPGVFAAGDLVDHTYRQAVTAAGSARRPRSTPSGTCATRPGWRRPRGCPRATSPRRSGRRLSTGG